MLDSFRLFLRDEYLDGQYPSPPVDPVGEPLPDIPLRIHKGDDSSVEDLFGEVWDDEDDDWGPDGDGRVAGGTTGLGQ